MTSIILLNDIFFISLMIYKPKKTTLSIWKLAHVLASCHLQRKHTGWKRLWKDEKPVHQKSSKYTGPLAVDWIFKSCNLNLYDCAMFKIWEAKIKSRSPVITPKSFQHSITILQRIYVIWEMTTMRINTSTSRNRSYKVPAHHGCLGCQVGKGFFFQCFLFIDLLKIMLLEMSSVLLQERNYEGCGYKNTFQWKDKQY